MPFCAQLSRARDRAVVVAVGSGLLNRLAGKVATDEAAIAKGAGALARGNNQLFRGAQKISSASGELSRSTTKLLTGAASVAQGAVTVNDAAVQLESGTQQTSSAATSLVSGSDSVSSGASSADSGAQQLSSGLEKGAKESPTYSSSQQDALAVAVSEPVQLSHSEQHAKHGNGWLLAALVAVILWLAALVGALGVDLSAARRHALALVSSRRLAFTQALPVVGRRAGAGRAVLLAMWIFHASVAEVVPFVLLTVLAAVTFSLLGHALRLASGGAGVMIFVLFLLVQVASLGNVIPLETAPSVLRTLNGMLPLTAYTNAASQLVSGGRHRVPPRSGPAPGRVESRRVRPDGGERQAAAAAAVEPTVGCSREHVTTSRSAGADSATGAGAARSPGPARGGSEGQPRRRVRRPTARPGPDRRRRRTRR